MKHYLLPLFSLLALLALPACLDDDEEKEAAKTTSKPVKTADYTATFGKPLTKTPPTKGRWYKGNGELRYGTTAGKSNFALTCDEKDNQLVVRHATAAGVSNTSPATLYTPKASYSSNLGPFSGGPFNARLAIPVSDPFVKQLSKAPRLAFSTDSKKATVMRSNGTVKRLINKCIKQAKPRKKK